jgi:DNA-binding NarL/FixJ family response regulator
VLAVVDALLDGLGTPAFIVGPHGEVAHANQAGRALMERDRVRVQDALRGSLDGREELFRTVQLAARGVPCHHMAVLRGGAFDFGPRLAFVGTRWGLTPKQTEVIAHLARGKCNKSIATELDCSEATVELHVSAILSKARCERRTELVAHFWSDG